MTLHAQSAQFIRMLTEQNAPAWQELSPSQGRMVFSSLTELFGEKVDCHKVQEVDLGGVRARMYRPAEGENLPTVVYFHGGGWVLGNVDSHDSLCRKIANASGNCVVSIEYRLSPEAQYPQPLHDCFDATKALFEQADELGIDSNRISVAGDSAGGNLAAAVAMKSRDDRAFELRSQILIYPVIEPNFETSSYRNYGSDHGLTRETMQWFWNQYIGDSLPQPNYAELLSVDKANLPNAFVLTAQYDVLVDEGVAFAQGLGGSGVEVKTKCYDGMLHGFVHFNGFFETASEAIQDIADFLQD